MKKTKIPWADYTINPVKGLCPMACSYCYARRIYKRFKWNPEIRYTDPGFTIAELQTIKKPARVFVGSTMELFLDWPEIWLRDTFTIIRQFPHHTFIFLTKQPQNLIKWSPFPDNCWVGLSVDGTPNAPAHRIYNGFDKVMATVKFLSVEPLIAQTKLEYRDFEWAGINWLILGSRTQPTQHPPREWVDEIISSADQAKIPVFVKEPMASHFGINRQEFPIRR